MSLKDHRSTSMQVQTAITKASTDRKIQLRTFHDLDLEPLKIQPFDGANLEPTYTSPTGPQHFIIDNHVETYGGSCHCGKASYELQCGPLQELELADCNCSICSRVCS